MRFYHAVVGALLGALCQSSLAVSTDGLQDLVKRRLPDHVDSFAFSLNASFGTQDGDYIRKNDNFEVSSAPNGTILIHGNSLSALATGLRRYLTEIAHVDIYWFVGSLLDKAPNPLPKLDTPLRGSSIVPWRYHLNTVTFGYTAAFWTWEDWELELDWAAIHGINLALAWVGYEHTLREAFKGVGLTDDLILPFFSGPAFQPWNRFGNIQGSWGGSDLPLDWINKQFELQKKIVARMVELGITPVLPAFPGFVPEGISQVLPEANVTTGATWGGFPNNYTQVNFLDPFDPLFSELQKGVINEQINAFGNVTNIYTLDQYNEILPASGDTGYLHNVSYNTWQGLKAADPSAIWLMQGWLFLTNDFWTDSRISAYLGGVEDNNDMLILDLFSETRPYWQQTKSYYGKPWIWCQMNDFGGSMSLYGQVMNITINATLAVAQSESLVGFGSSMESEQGNEIKWDLLFDQAWSADPIDPVEYFSNWTYSRYTWGSYGDIPQELFTAWEILAKTAYNNTNSSTGVTPKAILELAPSIKGLTDLAGFYPNPTTVNYDPAEIVNVWNLMVKGANGNTWLWEHPSFQYDIIDVTRQVLANAFIDYYNNLVSSYTAGSHEISEKGENILDLLTDLDTVLSKNKAFSLKDRISSARSWAEDVDKDFYEYNIRNQVTLWGPDGEISDYASKSWAGLVGSYYHSRWSIFIEYLAKTDFAQYNDTTLSSQLRVFENQWQTETSLKASTSEANSTLESILHQLKKSWPSIFESS
ncbi:uncharacterized protein TRUGW13939_04907 [Talaromyces rugulosus]|uniref:Alpha-N-acetylglucosaminidase n=1 Tax=Talaromyces rugulosus TaxID=121627 RepID=A0A7H8QUZ5_TALRU|nr:uncharacterized protein TRUGW13939_04907 [Talaromyces rugulosus]QKX57787.1 hypothetical protein TRUGW13939_04907 [Talaromyces rugulosus]